MELNIETIAAVATAPGRGGIGVVRVSGPASTAIAESILGECPKPRRAKYCAFLDDVGQPIDQGLAIFFHGPNSFTGEDVLELQGHGGPVVLDRLLKRTLALGARAARPGEFSERAFINGKMDLAQAEAIADLIEASSEQAAQSAMRSLQGDFSLHINKLIESLVQLRVFVEAAIDFPEEEIDFLSDGRIEKDLNQLVARLEVIRSSAKQGCLLREGMTLVLAGQPNVGKSSLLNRLAQRDAAIVTDIPGTTRDLLREQIHIDGMPLHIIDTAGLRDSDDPVEQEGVRRAWSAIDAADRILLLVDDSKGFTKNDQAILDRLPPALPVTVVHNKIDISGKPTGLGEEDAGPAIALSAKSGDGLELLVQHLESSMGFQQTEEGTFMARRRHLEALAAAATALEKAQKVLAQGAGELLAEELRLGQKSLGEITGKISSDELLGRIFSSFCIGK